MSDWDDMQDDYDMAMYGETTDDLLEDLGEFEEDDYEEDDY